MYDKFIDAMKIEDYNTRLCDIKTMVQQLPKAHYVVLEYLMKHLVRVSSRSNVNKMEPSNLAIVFGPSIIRKPESNVPDMQAAFADMMNMSFQNALVESMIIQAEVINL
jgi:D-serine dehydratase